MLALSQRSALVQLVSLVVTASSLGVNSLSAQAAAEAPNRVIGVYDARTGKPIESAVVLDIMSGTSAKTTATGTAGLGFVSFHGTGGLIELRKLGFESKQLLLAKGDTAPITEVLDPVPQLPTTVRTEPYRIDEDEGDWDGFARRCQTKSVTCFTPEELARHPDANVADLLVRADGVVPGSCSKMGRATVVRGLNSRNPQCGDIAMHPAAGTGYCPPTFFVDGFLWDSSLGPPIDMQPGRVPVAPYTTATVKAIEVYSSDRPRPLAFNGDPACGVVVLWTK